MQRPEMPNDYKIDMVVYDHDTNALYGIEEENVTYEQALSVLNSEKRTIIQCIILQYPVNS